MKKIIFFFCYIILNVELNAQENYTITKISGRIKTENGSYLKPGIRIDKNSILVYSTANDMIRAIGDNGRVYIFSAAKNINKNKDGLFKTILAQFIRTESRGNMSTRALSESIPFVEENLKSDGKIVLRDHNRFIFDTKKYNIKNGNLFFIQISKKDFSEKEMRPLKTLGDTVYIDYADVIPRDGNLENSEFRFGFYNHQQKISYDVLQTPIFFTYDVINNLETTTQNFINLYKDRPDIKKNKLRELIYNEILLVLGKPSQIEFLEIFEKKYSKKEIEIKKLEFGTGFIENKNHNIPTISERIISLTRSELPTSFTLKRFAPPIADQGFSSSCGSWATSYAARSILYNYSRNLSGNNDSKMSFSPEFVYFKTRKQEGCRLGTYLTDALEILKNEGTIYSKNLTFDCDKTFTEDEIKSASKYKIKGSEFLNSNQKNIVTLIKETLAQRNQPVVIGIKIPKINGKSSFMNLEGDGVWRISSEEYEILKNPDAQTGGHAITIIGYNDNPEILGGAFEIMNSWGSDYWGKNGYCWISYEDLPKVLLQAFTITDLSEAPPVLPLVPKNTEETTPKSKYNGSISFLSVDETGNTIANLDIEKTPNQVQIFTFKVTQTLENGSRFKINYHSKSPSYLYLINYDYNEVNALFPYDFTKENPIIDIKDALLVLPDFKKGYRLSADSNTEQLCFLISKEELNIQEILKKINLEKPRNFQEFMKTNIKNIAENIDFISQKKQLEFTSEYDEKKPKTIMLFINLRHEEIKQYNK